jgi:uncharacterized integral membrane protein
MNTFKRHKVSIFFLFLYSLWWVYVIYYFTFKNNTNVSGSDYSSVAIIFLSILIGFTFAIVFLIAALINKEPKRTDYLEFLAFVTLPLILGGICLVSNS